MSAYLDSIPGRPQIRICAAHPNYTCEYADYRIFCYQPAARISILTMHIDIEYGYDV